MVINLKNKLWIILALIIIISICIAIFFFTKNNNTNNSNYNSSRTSTTEQNNTENNYNNSSNNNVIENETNTIQIMQNSTDNDPKYEQKSEEEISSFSTKIYTKETSRQNNVSIACSALNDTIVPNGSVFSFCNTLGPATPNQGYQEADIFDKDGNKIKGIGGGKCQISTTLYNAVLQTPGLVVTERHPHSNKVPYIQNGKDAAVAYGSYDLKFRNDTGFDIKIKAEATSDNIIITLFKVV